MSNIPADFKMGPLEMVPPDPLEVLLGEAKRQSAALERIAIAVEMLALPGTHEDPDRHGTRLCTQCPTFVCENCHLLRPACVGDADSDPDWCDDCLDLAKEPPPG